MKKLFQSLFGKKTILTATEKAKLASKMVSDSFEMFHKAIGGIDEANELRQQALTENNRSREAYLMRVSDLENENKRIDADITASLKVKEKLTEFIPQ